VINTSFSLIGLRAQVATPDCVAQESNASVANCVPQALSWQESLKMVVPVTAASAQRPSTVLPLTILMLILTTSFSLRTLPGGLCPLSGSGLISTLACVPCAHELETKQKTATSAVRHKNIHRTILLLFIFHSFLFFVCFFLLLFTHPELQTLSLNAYHLLRFEKYMKRGLFFPKCASTPPLDIVHFRSCLYDIINKINVYEILAFFY
jgi:hypothetical protein